MAKQLARMSAVLMVPHLAGQMVHWLETKWVEQMAHPKALAKAELWAFERVSKREQ